MTCCPIDFSSATGGVTCGGSAFVDVVGDVYDGVIFVLPLDEFGVGDTDEYVDRTGNGLHGTGGPGGTIDLAPEQDQGVFCTFSAHSDGRQYITLPEDGLDEAQSFTASMWFRFETFYKERTFFSRGFDSVDGDKLVFSFGHSFLNTLQASINVLTSQGVTMSYELRGDTTLTQNTWYHVAVSWERGVGLKVYLDGVLDGELEVTELQTVSLTNGNFLFRKNEASVPEGNLQEVRFYPEAKSAAYLKAEHDNYCVSQFYTVGAEEDDLVSVT